MTEKLPKYLIKQFETANPNRIIVWTTKHYTSYYRASTLDDLRAFAFDVFEYLANGYWESPVLPTEPDVPKTAIETLPPSLQKVVNTNWEQYDKKLKAYKEELYVYEMWLNRNNHPITSLYELQYAGYIDFEFEYLVEVKNVN